jgi:hypothetical protein
MPQQWHHHQASPPYGRLDRAGTPDCRRLRDELVRSQRRAQFWAGPDGGRSPIAYACGVRDRILAIELAKLNRFGKRD